MYQKTRRRTDPRQHAPNRFLALRSRFAGGFVDVVAGVTIVAVVAVMVLL